LNDIAEYDSLFNGAFKKIAICSALDGCGWIALFHSNLTDTLLPPEPRTQRLDAVGGYYIDKRDFAYRLFQRLSFVCF